MFTTVCKQKHFGKKLNKLLSALKGSYCLETGKEKSMQSVI